MRCPGEEQRAKRDYLSVPNGGYVASVFLAVARTHLLSRNQPHTISAHWSYVNRTEAGRALIRVSNTKIGRGTSVLHIILHQYGLLAEAPFISPDSPAQVVAYITNGNLSSETGVTLPTQWTLDHQPPEIDLAKVVTGDDPNWEKTYLPLMKKVPMLHHVEYYSRRGGHVLPTTHDYWIRFAVGDGFTPTSLGFVADVGPPLIIESFRPSEPNAPIPLGGFAFNKGFWYPTLTMTLDVRRELPEEGVNWLRLRVTAKEVRNGRYDAEVVMFDEAGDLVALSNHVSMAIDIERNYAERNSTKGKI